MYSLILIETPSVGVWFVGRVSEGYVSGTSLESAVNEDFSSLAVTLNEGRKEEGDLCETNVPDNPSLEYVLLQISR